MTVLEMLHFYEELVREHEPSSKYFRYKIGSNNFNQAKNAFKRLKIMLNDHNIQPKDFIRSQFYFRGGKLYPNYLPTKTALNKYKRRGIKDIMKGYHQQQVEYLESLIEVGYSREEALSFDVFNYYFRYLNADYFPKKWFPKVKREIKIIPGLEQFLKEIKVDNTI